MAYTPLAQRQLPPEAMERIAQMLANSRAADMQQGAANARMNPSTYGFGGSVPDPRAVGLAALPAAFSPAEMAQWDQQQGFHSEMAGGRPMWVAPNSATPDNGLSYADWQRTQPTSRFGGYAIENGSPTDTKVSIPKSGKDAESRDRVAANAAQARLGVSMDAAKKKQERYIAAEAQKKHALTDPVSQQARANSLRRAGVPMQQAQAIQQMLAGGPGNPVAAELAMRGGGALAVAQQQQQNAQANADRDFQLRKAEMDAKIAATQGAAYKTEQEMGPRPDASTDPAGAARWDARNQQHIAAGNLAGPAPGQGVPAQAPGGFQPTPVSGPGPGQNPYDQYNPEQKQKWLNWNAEQAGQINDQIAADYDQLFSSNAGLSLRWGANNAENREATIKLLESLGKPRAAIEKWYDLRYGPVVKPTPTPQYSGYPTGV